MQEGGYGAAGGVVAKEREGVGDDEEDDGEGGGANAAMAGLAIALLCTSHSRSAELVAMSRLGRELRFALALRHCRCGRGSSCRLA